MPTPPHRIPDLPNRCFTTAEASAHGVTIDQLKGCAYVSFGIGIWTVANRVRPEDPAARLLDLLPAFQQVRPASVASHTSAALLHGMRLPARLRLGSPVHVTQRNGGHSLEATGIVGHESPVPITDLVECHGVRVTAPTRTAVDLAAMRTGPRQWLLSDAELTAILDGVINEHRFGYAAGVPAMRNLTDVRADLNRMDRRRGVARLRKALLRSRVGADSALESRTRLILEDHGLSGWLMDTRLRVPGHRDVYPDLAHPGLKISIQIEGPHHDQQKQRIRDIERQRATEAGGWIEVRVSIEDLLVQPWEPVGTVPRVVQLVRQARRRRDLALVP